MDKPPRTATQPSLHLPSTRDYRKLVLIAARISERPPLGYIHSPKVATKTISTPMHELTIKTTSHDFGAVRAAMQGYVDRELLSGVSWAVLQGRDLIDVNCVGWANREAKTTLTTDHLFRAFSNTKLVTSCAVLLLLEAGKLELNDPIERYIPQLANRRVLKAGATTLADIEPANTSITVRHLLSHSAGLSYGLFDPGTLIFTAYNERKVFGPTLTLAEMVDALADLPLLFQPGTSFEYSIATDVLARLIEVVSGERFDAFIKSHIFDRLGMIDTTFVVPLDQQHRLAAYYRGADLIDPMKPGLTRVDNSPYAGAYLRAVPKLSGGGGLVMSLADMVALMRGLLPGGETLLKPETIAQMMTNQLADDVSVRFATQGDLPGKGFGLGGSVTQVPSSIEPQSATGEFQWGGLAGTHWWISPRHNLAAVVMTQRVMAFWHPFSFEFKRLVYQAVDA